MTKVCIIEEDTVLIIKSPNGTLKITIEEGEFNIRVLYATQYDEANQLAMNTQDFIALSKSIN